MMFLPAFTTNTMTSDSLSSISPCWVVMPLDSHRTMFTFLSWLDLLGVVLVFISILKSSNHSSKLLTHCYKYHKLRKTFGKFVRSYTDLLSKFGEISFKEYVSEGISHPVVLLTLKLMIGRSNILALVGRFTPSHRLKGGVDAHLH